MQMGNKRVMEGCGPSPLDVLEFDLSFLMSSHTNSNPSLGKEDDMEQTPAHSHKKPSSSSSS
eukprot:1486309-Karenia_brevis.AAC.1